MESNVRITTTHKKDKNPSYYKNTYLKFMTSYWEKIKTKNRPRVFRKVKKKQKYQLGSKRERRPLFKSKLKT